MVELNATSGFNRKLIIHIKIYCEKPLGQKNHLIRFPLITKIKKTIFENQA